MLLFVSLLFPEDWSKATSVAKAFGIGKTEAGAVAQLMGSTSEKVRDTLTLSVRARGMKGYILHEIVEKGIFSIGFSSGVGAAEAWESQLTNKPDNELVCGLINSIFSFQAFATEEHFNLLSFFFWASCLEKLGPVLASGLAVSEALGEDVRHDPSPAEASYEVRASPEIAHGHRLLLVLPGSSSKGSSSWGVPFNPRPVGQPIRDWFYGCRSGPCDGNDGAARRCLQHICFQAWHFLPTSFSVVCFRVLLLLERQHLTKLEQAARQDKESKAQALARQVAEASLAQLEAQIASDQELIRQAQGNRTEQAVETAKDLKYVRDRQMSLD